MMRTAAVNQSTKKQNKNQNFFLFVSEHRCRDQLTTPTRSQSSEDEQNLETMQPMETNLKEKLGIAGQFDGDQRKNVSRLTAVEWRGMQKKCETASGFGCVGVCFFRLYVASEGDKFKGERRARIRTQKGKVVGENGTIGKGWMITALFGKELSLSGASSPHPIWAHTSDPLEPAKGLRHSIGPSYGEGRSDLDPKIKFSSTVT